MVIQCPHCFGDGYIARDWSGPAIKCIFCKNTGKVEVISPKNNSTWSQAFETASVHK